MLTIFVNNIPPKEKYYIPFPRSAHKTPQIFASLFSLPTIRSMHKYYHCALTKVFPGPQSKMQFAEYAVGKTK